MTTNEKKEKKAALLELRCVALTAASRTGGKTTEKVLKDADCFYRWLVGQQSIVEILENREEN